MPGPADYAAMVDDAFAAAAGKTRRHAGGFGYLAPRDTQGARGFFPGRMPNVDVPEGGAPVGPLDIAMTTLGSRFRLPAMVAGMTLEAINPAQAGPSAAIKRLLQSSDLVKLEGKDAAQKFHDAVAKAKAAHPHSGAVDLHSVEDYSKAKALLLSKDSMTGGAVAADGTMNSVFNHPQSGVRGAGPVIAERAVKEGADRLDAYDTVLPAMYRQGAGFQEVARVPFNPKFVAPDFDPAAFQAFSGKTPTFAQKVEDIRVGGPGEPDLVGMVANPPGPVRGLPTPGFGELQELQRLALIGRHPVAFIPEARRVHLPGIYDDPRQIAREAAAMVPKEDPALQRLFGVSRPDLYEMARAREATGLGNLPPPPGLPQNPRGAAAASAIMTPENRQRLVDVLGEGAKYPEIMHGMYPWYIQDPVFKRMVELGGFQHALENYPRLNTLQGLASPRSNVLAEINRGTGAYMLSQQRAAQPEGWVHPRGLFPRFAVIGEGGGTGIAEGIGGHFAHKMHTKAMESYLRTGKLPQAEKTPAYIQSAGVPETGYSWTYPTGDLHFVGGLGLPDVRTARTAPVQLANIGPSELAALTPWWTGITADVGMNPSSGQAVNWALFAKPTGVKTDIGVPKLELQARRIMEEARRTGKSPERVRDELLQPNPRGHWLIPAAVVPTGAAMFDQFATPEVSVY